MNPYFITNEEIGQMNELEVEIHFGAEMDEFWSFVGDKSNQRWTWYAILVLCTQRAYLYYVLSTQ